MFREKEKEIGKATVDSWGHESRRRKEIGNTTVDSWGTNPGGAAEVNVF